MATPIAHKGVTAGAKVQAMTMLDMLTRPELVQQAWDYFRNVQTKDQKYTPFIGPNGQAGGVDERKIMEQVSRPEMKKFYYDPAKYKTYLEQLGIKYPTVGDASSRVRESGLDSAGLRSCVDRVTFGTSSGDGMKS